MSEVDEGTGTQADFGADPEPGSVGGETVVVRITADGWVDFPYVPEGISIEVHDFGSETKTEELVEQELEEALARARSRARSQARGRAA